MVLSKSKEPASHFVDLRMTGDAGLLALTIRGPGITRIAVYYRGSWYPKDLIEPTALANGSRPHWGQWFSLEAMPRMLACLRSPDL